MGIFLIFVFMKNDKDLKPGYVYSNGITYYLYLGYDGIEEDYPEYPNIVFNLSDSEISAFIGGFYRIVKDEDRIHISEFLEENPEFIKRLLSNYEIVYSKQTPERTKIVNSILNTIKRKYKLERILK